jgi:YD repeat-containing protein
LLAIACLLALLALAAQPGAVPLASRFDLGRAFGGDMALAQGSGVVIDLGDPLISDEHVDFMDRGRYPFQDMARGPCCGTGSAAGLVNVVHGNLIYSRQDILIPGRGLPLEIQFTYNSGSFFDGRYGYGWQLNYDLRYITNNVNDNVIVVREDDRTDIFVKQSDGSFRSTYGVRDTLEEYEPDRYVLTDGLGVSYWFESPDHHYVTRIEDLNGNSLIFGYNPQRALTTVTDAAGRQLTLTYSDDKLAAITDPQGRVFQYAYDGNGNLVQVTDPGGYITQYAYEGECHDLVSITDASGNTHTITYNGDYQVATLDSCCETVAFDYDLLGRQTTMTDGNGFATTYRYDHKKRVIAVEDALGNTMTRTWDSDYNLTGVTDANGNAYAFAYDGRGNVVAETDPLGNSTTYTWHPSFDRLTTITDPAGRTTTYEYDGQGNLIRQIDPLGGETLYSYDGTGLLTELIDARAHSTHFEYDGYGNLTRRIDALGGDTQYGYDVLGNLLSRTDANGYTTAYSYDSLNRLLTVTDTLSCVTTYSYDPVGNRISETDANGHTTLYAYDGANRLVNVTDALGYVSTYAYDAAGNIVAESDANGNTTLYAYDGANRLVDVTDALGYVSTYSYDPVGNRISETDAEGNTTTYSYDPLNRLVGVTDALGYVTTYSYDPVGNRIGETDALGNTTSYSYDDLDRLMVLTNPLGYSTTYSYDSVGNRISETDANGHTTSYSYDPLNRLEVFTKPLGSTYTTTYSYDPVGNLLSRTDANGNEWTYEYDALNRGTRAISPMGHETVYTYDCVGNRTTRTDPNGATTTYDYDEIDRLVTLSYPGGGQVSYAYDGVGNRLHMTNTVGLGDLTDRIYDAGNRLIAETIDYGLFLKSVSYTYDGLDNITTLTDPDGEVLTYEYDPLGNVAVVTDPNGGLTTFAYDELARETRRDFPNGVWTEYVYDDAGQVTHITTRDAADILVAYEYLYDPAGQMVDASRDGVPEATYQYNAAGWLTGADYSPYHDYVYTYDTVGNRLTKEEGPAVTSYLYNNEDRVLTQTFPDTSAIDYVYDDNANVIQTISAWGTVDYAYDLENRLTEIAYPGPFGTILNFYSPEGKRLARDERGQWTYFYPTLLGVVVEMDGAGLTTTRLNPGLSMGPGGPPAGEGDVTLAPESFVHWDGRDSTTYFTTPGTGEQASFGFGYFGEMLYSSGEDDVDPGLYATNMKVDWDPLLGAELIGGDYAPDIDQHFGGYLFDPNHVVSYVFGPQDVMEWPPRLDDGGPLIDEETAKELISILERLYQRLQERWEREHTPSPEPVPVPEAVPEPPPQPVPVCRKKDCKGGCMGQAVAIYDAPGRCRQHILDKVCRVALRYAKAEANKQCVERAGPRCTCSSWYHYASDPGMDEYEDENNKTWCAYGCPFTVKGYCFWR